LLAGAQADAEAGIAGAIGVERGDDGRTEAEGSNASAQVRAAPATPAPLEPLPDDLVRYLDEVERAILVRALERQNFNRTAAGASLGLSLRQMRYRMARLGITESESADPL
jgi:two-component system response regulator PilR (NtrC family)